MGNSQLTSGGGGGSSDFWDQDVDVTVGDETDNSSTSTDDSRDDDQTWAEEVHEERDEEISPETEAPEPDAGSKEYTEGGSYIVGSANFSDGSSSSDSPADAPSATGNDTSGDAGATITSEPGDDAWSDSGSGGGYTTVTNDGTESTVNDTDPVQGDDASDYEESASDGVWGEGDGSAPDNSDGSDTASTEEQINAALAEQRAAYEEQMAALMEDLPVPDQLGGSESGGGLSPALAGVALLAVGGGALYAQGDR